MQDQRYPPAAWTQLQLSFSILKPTNLTYVTEVKQMSQENRFLVWREISGSKFYTESRQTRLLEFTQNCGKVTSPSTHNTGMQRVCTVLFFDFVWGKCSHFILVVFICIKITSEVSSLSPVNLARNLTIPVSYYLNPIGSKEGKNISLSGNLWWSTSLSIDSPSVHLYLKILWFKCDMQYHCSCHL